MVTISEEEYEELLENTRWLSFLEAAGIDDSPYWHEAMYLRRLDQRNKEKE